MNGNLTHLCREDAAFHADKVADIQVLELRVRLVSKVIAGDIDLDLPVTVLHMSEAGLAHHALRHQTARDGNLLILVVGIVFLNLPAVRVLVIGHDFVGILPRVNQRLQLLAAHFAQLIQILGFAVLHSSRHSLPSFLVCFCQLLVISRIL